MRKRLLWSDDKREEKSLGFASSSKRKIPSKAKCYIRGRFLYENLFLAYNNICICICVDIYIYTYTYIYIIHVLFN